MINFIDLNLTRAEALACITNDEHKYADNACYLKTKFIYEGIELDYVGCPAFFEDLADEEEEINICYAYSCRKCWEIFLNKYFDKIEQEKLE